MAKVSAAIKRVLKEKDAGLVSGSESMLAILKDLHGQIMAEMGRAALGSWDAYHLRQVLDSIEYQMANFTGRAKQELSGQLDIAWAAGKKLVDTPLSETGIYTGYHLSTSVLDSLKEYSNDYLQGLFQDAWYKVKGEINLGIIGDKTPQEVTAAIGKTIDSGRFKNIATRAEIITKNEMGTVFSKATQMRMEQAAAEIPGLEKEWVHAGHPKVARPAHLAANGQRVPVGEPFSIGAYQMMFPKDPGAPLSEIINCGCDHVPYHKDWA